MPDIMDLHYGIMAKAIREGRVVPFFGAGANLCGRPPDTPWQPGQYLPSGSELSAHLAKSFGYPAGDPMDLVRVSQYAAVMAGSGPLYEELRKLFDKDYRPTPLHQFFAGLPALLRDRAAGPAPFQLIVTTNYDDLLERSFQLAGEPYDLVSYIAEGEGRGKFLHCRTGQGAVVIEKPNEYRGLPTDQGIVILKIHGAVDRDNPDRDSFVITEDHYIDYLTHTDISNLVPVTLAAKLKRSHFLFLGYGLRDWNLRVILHRIWGEQKLTYKSWAIQLNPSPLDLEYWRKRDVDILDIRLDDYVSALTERMQGLARAGGSP